MAYTSFLSEFYQNRPLPVATETRGSGRTDTELRDFDMKSAEAQRIFVWGNSDPSGVVVNDDTILSSTPFFGAVRYVTEGLAMLDRKVRRKENNRFIDDNDHPVAYLMKRRPNPFMTWFDLISAWVANAMLGNGYLLIIWDRISGRPIRLEHVPSRFVWPEFDHNSFLWYRISGEINGRQITTIVPHTDILHLKGLSLDGLTGRKTSILHKAAHSTSLSADTYSESVFGKAAFPSIAVKTSESLDATEAYTMEQNLMDRAGGAKNAGRPFVLDSGQDIQFLQWSPIDAALEAVRHLSVEQVSQITKVPRDLLALDTHGTYGAAVQRSRDFYVHCLQPWVEKIQEEINTKLFTEIEIVLGTHQVELDSSLYLSLSPSEQVEMFSHAIKSSQLTPNEAREAMGRDAMSGGDQLYGDINMVPLDSVAQIALAKYLSSEGEKVLQSGDVLGLNTEELVDSEPNTIIKDKDNSNTDNEQETQPAS